MNDGNRGNGTGIAPSWMPWAVLAGLLIAVVVGVAVVNNRLDSIEGSLGFHQNHIEAPSGPAVEVEVAPDARIVYVPVYSHVYAVGGRPVLLEATLSVRNTDVTKSFTLTTVRYFDTDGIEVKSFLENPVTIGPLATVEFLVKAKDVSGGSGANFILQWQGEDGLNPPIFEAVMVGMDGTHGMGFVSQGVEVGVDHSPR